MPRASRTDHTLLTSVGPGPPALPDDCGWGAYELGWGGVYDLGWGYMNRVPPRLLLLSCAKHCLAGGSLCSAWSPCQLPLGVALSARATPSTQCSNPSIPALNQPPGVAATPEPPPLQVSRE